jgi:predicted Ser/Thr protein kinase
MNCHIVEIVQEILQKSKIEFYSAAEGTFSKYYVDTSLNFGVKVFFNGFEPRDEIKEITNKAHSLGIANKIYEVSKKFKFILMENLNGYEKISNSKIIKKPSNKDNFYLKKVLKYWVKLSEIQISHFDIYSYNVLVNHSNGDVKLIDFDEYKLGNRNVLIEYLIGSRFMDFLFYPLLDGECADDFKKEKFENVLVEREKLFSELITKNKFQIGRNTVENKIMQIPQSDIDSIVNQILGDIKDCFIEF